MYGKYSLLNKSNPDVYAYTRELGNKKVLVLLNFKSTAAVARTDMDLDNAKILLCNYKTPSVHGNLQPYEAIIYELP